MLKRRVSHLAILIALSLFVSEQMLAQGTGTVKGSVVDAETGMPLAGANIFLSQTQHGAATNIDGRFEIRNIPSGAYELAATMIGYKPALQKTYLSPYDSVLQVDLQLIPTVLEAGELVISARRPRNWQSNLKRFESLFLGESPNASRTVILNPHVLDFQENRLLGVFSATASEPLQIENRALGYRITFILTEFTYRRSRNELSYGGPIYFEELVSAGEREDALWRQNREYTFRGSARHLLWALINHRPEEEGFSIFQASRTGQVISPQLVPANRIIHRTQSPHEFTVSFPDVLHVRFSLSTRPAMDAHEPVSAASEVSWLTLSGKTAIVHASGYVYDPEYGGGAIVFQGALATQRVADLLPYEYRLDTDAPRLIASGMLEPADKAGRSHDNTVRLMPVRSSFLVREDSRDAESAHSLEVQNVLRSALEAMRTGHWREARRLLGPVLTRYPDNFEARYYHVICDQQEYFILPTLVRWQSASNHLEWILQRDSLYRDVVYQYALLLRNDEQYHRAIEVGHRQLRLRPDLWHTEYGLFQLYRAYLNNSNFNNAATWLDQQATEHATFFRADALRRAGLLEEAEAVLQGLAMRKLRMPVQPVYLSLARIYYAKNEPEIAQRFVEQAIDEITGPLGAHLVFEDAKYIVSQEELDQFRGISDANAFRTFFQAFWTSRNPMPATRINVRQQEHYRRMLTAEKDHIYALHRMYSRDKLDNLEYPPAYELNDQFNDRGVIYIRHGEPDDRVFAIWDDNTIRESLRESFRPNESWRYFNPLMDFHFVIEGSGNNWALMSGLLFTPEYLASREDWGGIYAELARGAHEYAQTRHVAGETLTRRWLANARGNSILLNMLIEDSKRYVLLGLNTDRHSWGRGIEPLEMPHLFATYRGNDGATDAVIHYAIPVGLISRSLGRSEDSILVEVGVAVFDSAWNKLDAVVRQHQLTGSIFAQTVYVDKMELRTAPGVHYVALSIHPEGSNLLGGYRWQETFEDFTQPVLSMSSIVLAHEIDLLTESPHSRTDVVIRTNPTLRFSVNAPVHVYFETYNLSLGNDNRSNYSVELRLVPRERNDLLSRLRRDFRPALSLQSVRSGTEEAPIEFTEIDVRSVSPGKYTLLVKVTDHVTGASAENSRPLELMR